MYSPGSWNFPATRSRTRGDTARAAHGVADLRREDLDGSDVGQRGHHELRQLPAGGVHVQRGPDAGGRDVEHRQIAAGALQFLPLVVGRADLQHDADQADVDAVGLDPVVAAAPVPPVPPRQVAGQAAERRVAGQSVPEHRSQHMLALVELRQHGRDAPAAVLGRRQAVDQGLRRVHVQVAQIRVVEGDPGRRPVEEDREDGHVERRRPGVRFGLHLNLLGRGGPPAARFSIVGRTAPARIRTGRSPGMADAPPHRPEPAAGCDATHRSHVTYEGASQDARAVKGEVMARNTQ